MTRDAEMPARDYVELVLRRHGAETEIGVVQSLAGAAAAALAVSPTRRRAPTGWPGSPTSAGDACARPSPASDHQLAWARAFAARPARRSTSRSSRACSTAPRGCPGLAVDAELRWTLLRALVVSARPATPRSRPS